MRWIAQYFARAVVRRVAYVVVAFVFAALQMCSMPAHAARYDALDQGEAFAVCQGALSAAQAIPRAQIVYACVLGTTSYRCSYYDGQAEYGCKSKLGISDTFDWPPGETCGSRNRNKLADAAPWYSEPSTCFGGCEVQGTPFSSQSGGVKTYGMKDRTYNGSVCKPSKPTNDIGEVDKEKEDALTPKQPECVGLGGGQTGCVKPNGDYCATASTGKTFCWTPTETGKKTDAPDAQVKSPKGDPVTPPDLVIPDKDWQRTEGHQQTACVNDKCTTYNVTNYSSVPSGTAKNSTGDNSADGSGNTSGNGKPGASDSDDGKEGDKDSASESGNCTVAPICVGDTLKCLHLKFTWKTQCNTERGEVEGGKTCADGDIPVCAGKSCKAAEYTQVLQSWRTRCGLEKDRDAAKADSDRGAADAAGDDEKGEVAKLWASDGKPGPHLDQNRLSIGGGDLLGGSIDIMGTPFTLNAQFYDALAIIKKIIIAAAMVAALWILWRS
ncbi:A coat protein [Xanthomonas campestris pv. nigromaculans]|nr:A coat protein [Xanthomonas campestris pv. nigromaculans]CAH2708380.1 A coat protein [Xanthomonas campestris pv. nigromaculans]